MKPFRNIILNLMLQQLKIYKRKIVDSIFAKKEKNPWKVFAANKNAFLYFMFTLNLLFRSRDLF